jgi:hypothetical protein
MMILPSALDTHDFKSPSTGAVLSYSRIWVLVSVPVKPVIEIYMLQFEMLAVTLSSDNAKIYCNLLMHVEWQ